MSSLVVQTSFLGDVVLTTPLIAELAKRGPVDVLTTPEGSAILKHDPGIRNLIVYDRRNADRGLAGFARMAARIRSAARQGAGGASSGSDVKTGYSTAYLAQGSIRSALLVISTGVKRRIGFNTSEGSRLYTDRVEYRPDRHHAERLWWLSMMACADPPSPAQITPRLYPSSEDVTEAASMLSEQFDDHAKTLVALAPGSAWGTKRWPYFPQLAAELSGEFNVVVVGGQADIEAGSEILNALPKGTAVNAAGRLGILASASVIGQAAALVSNDSAPQHLASAMGTPTVCVFGPTVPEFGFGPLAEGSRVAGLDGLACRPCDRHGPQQCPLGHWRCMRDVSVGAVFDLLTQTLRERVEA